MEEEIYCHNVMNTFYYSLYGDRRLVKDHRDDGGNQQPPFHVLTD